MHKTLHIVTYGCQMNVYDSQRIEEMFTVLGYTLKDQMDADVVIFNTCQIREKAEEKLFSDLGRVRLIKEFRKTNEKDMVIIVAGCSAQALGKNILKRAPYVDLVVGPQTYDKIPELLAKVERLYAVKDGPGRGILGTGFPKISKFDNLKVPRGFHGVSAVLSIQEGCNKFCTYCVVPYTRGAEYSRPLDDILNEARILLKEGAKELVLLGQNVNAYRSKTALGKEVAFSELLYRCAELEGVHRLRYMTSHPREMTPCLIQAHKEIPQLMPFLHLPVQSGSNRVLQAMNRQYTVQEYELILEELRKARPDIAFSSDFIVGHPGETEEDFQETCQLADRVGYAQAYSFMYSARPGTPSALKPQISIEIKKRRLHQLQEILQRTQQAFNLSKKGERLPVLFEKNGKKLGQILGKSPYMQSVYVHALEDIMGSIQWVEIQKSHLNSLAGSLAPPS
ncbi:MULTISPECIES: tRNA (N6-isopentenyl adenosine(37)-C2)-methylthiotransferase MiaB [Holospora]|uniref:tRNA-2-methylthio-N(6)-dimethylallyladenosine synthase n=2 Tax=Holospora TaxID=44747 RepID=A0A061JH00_9PROT|nr:MULTISPECIES: tRNA (N6-isopentenyl adenosine(37)-C2)-methylthiotransferase MiaB [Holospora]ETZ04542.1 (Dimethylallyl)adenosine tRNA methylthiotransferase MiaB [Holospora undulata HU1]GAJ46461.1 (Dimethylallyl)adenosine tRNA methylthiotransferase MiaB [Holospora elegans E1]